MYVLNKQRDNIKMDSPEKLATYGTQDEDKQTKNTTQYVLGTTILNPLPMVYRPPYRWYNEPLAYGILTPYAWYIEPYTYVILTPFRWYIEPLPLVNWTPFLWY